MIHGIIPWKYLAKIPDTFLRPVLPQSEVLVKFVQKTGEKCSENLAKNFADFRPSISRESVRKKSHEKSSTFSPLHQIKFFHCCNSGRWGPDTFLQIGQGSDGA